MNDWNEMNGVVPYQSMSIQGEKPTKTVYDLLMEGSLDEAYAMALQTGQKSNATDRDKKSYGYVLMKLIKREAQAGNRDKVYQYWSELAPISLRISDDKFESGKRGVLYTVYPEYGKAWSLYKEGKYREAASLAYQMYKINPAIQEIEKLLLTVLYKAIKEVASKPNPQVKEVKPLLDVYFSISGINRRFYDKYIWNHIVKFEKEATTLDLGGYYLSTMKSVLDPEYYQRVKKETVPSGATKGSEYWESMYCKMTNHVLKHIEGSNNVPLLKAVCDSVAQHESSIVRDEAYWINWRRGKILLACKEYEKARECFMNKIESKGNEYWVWMALGDTYVEDTSNIGAHESSSMIAMSAYCNGLWRNPDIKYVAAYKLKLAHLMVQRKEYEAASIEVSEVLAREDVVGKKNIEAAKKLQSASWYVVHPKEKNNRTFYQTHRTMILDELYPDEQWASGVIVNAKTYKEKQVYRCLFITREGELPIELILRKTDLDRISFAPGKSVKAKIKHQKDVSGCETGAYSILGMVEGPSVEGIFKEEYGVVNYMNHQKDVAHIVTNGQQKLFLPNASKYKVCVLSPVHVVYSVYQDRKGTIRQYIERIHKAKDEDIVNLKAHVKGTLTKNASNFAFLKEKDYIRLDWKEAPKVDSIYVDAYSIEEHRLETGVIIEGMAISTYNKSRDSWGWKLVKILDVRYDTHEWQKQKEEVVGENQE